MLAEINIKVTLKVMLAEIYSQGRLKVMLAESNSQGSVSHASINTHASSKT